MLDPSWIANQIKNVIGVEIEMDGMRGRIRPERRGEDERRWRACAFGVAASDAMIDGGIADWVLTNNRCGGADEIGSARGCAVAGPQPSPFGASKNFSRW